MFQKQCAYVFLVVLALPCGVISAANETPCSTSIKVYLPCNDSLADNSECMTDSMCRQGYVFNTNDRYADEDDDDDTVENCTIGNFRGLVHGGSNLWLCSHGNVDKLIIESYNGYDAREERYKSLVDLEDNPDDNYNPYKENEVVRGSYDGKFAIAITDLFLAKYSVANKQIVWVGACWSMTKQHADKPSLCEAFNAGLALGYTDECTDWQDDTNATALFGLLDGSLGLGAFRQSGNALAETGYFTSNFSYTGSIKTSIVLAPTVLVSVSKVIGIGA